MALKAGELSREFGTGTGMAPAARRRVRLLDTCLENIEEACLRGEATLSEHLARRVSPYVSGVIPGMRTTEALELVFREQEGYLWHDDQVAGAGEDVTVSDEARLRPVGLRKPSAAARALTASEARSLTEQIKAGVRRISVLLLEAHDRQAWLALGYSSWAQYVLQEFGFSRSRSYELLDHARICQELGHAAGLSSEINIPPRVACRIKPLVGQLAERIRAESGGLPAVAAQRNAEELVRQMSARLLRKSHVSSAAVSVRSDLNRLRVALEVIAELPPPRTVAGALGGREPEWLDSVPPAIAWLQAFATERERRQGTAR